jgi:Zn-dependent peptidase ImmA (M78 family)
MGAAAPLVNELGFTLVFEEQHTDLSGFFALATKVISINSAHAVNHQVKTLVHELAHALLYLTDRDGPDLSYAQEELVVESIVFRPTRAAYGFSAGRTLV